jgi:ribonuclease HI
MNCLQAAEKAIRMAREYDIRKLLVVTDSQYVVECAEGVKKKVLTGLFLIEIALN